MTEVKTFKLMSGEEVIGKLIEKNEDKLYFEKLRVLFPRQNADGSFALGMMPYMLSAENPDTGMESNVELKESAIVGRVVNVPSRLETIYLETVSGIALVK